MNKIADLQRQIDRLREDVNQVYYMLSALVDHLHLKVEHCPPFRYSGEVEFRTKPEDK